MAAAPLILQVAGTALSAYSSHQQGKAADEAAEYEAAQITANAERSAAAGLRQAEEIRRQKRVAMSDARAAQASSGGSTTDAGALDQLGRLGGIFEYNALEQIYGSQADASGMYGQAAARRFEGKMAKRTGNTAALSTVLSSAGNIYGQYKSTKIPKGNEIARPSRLPPGTRSPALGPF